MAKLKKEREISEFSTRQTMQVSVGTAITKFTAQIFSWRDIFKDCYARYAIL